MALSVNCLLCELKDQHPHRKTSTPPIIPAPRSWRQVDPQGSLANHFSQISDSRPVRDHVLKIR